MRVETLLPLGKLDPGLRASDTPLDLGRVIEDARLVESLGYDGLAVEETKVEVHGLGDLAAELAVLSRAQRWEEMPARIDDEVLHTYAVVGTYAEIGRKLVERYRGLVTDVEFSIPAATPDERGILRELVQEIRRETA